MARFYGSVWGHRGEATRMGNASSGITAWAQGWGSRITVRFWANRDLDAATVSLGGGGSTYHRGGSLNFNNIDAVVEALSGDDPKIQKIWARIQKDIDKLNDEAPAAIRRIERRQKLKTQQERREREEKAARLMALRETITERERHFYCELVAGMDEDERMRYFPTDSKIDEAILSARTNIEPSRNEKGDLIIGTRAGGDWGRRTMYNLTAGMVVTNNDSEEVTV